MFFLEVKIWPKSKMHILKLRSQNYRISQQLVIVPKATLLWNLLINIQIVLNILESIFQFAIWNCEKLIDLFWEFFFLNLLKLLVDKLVILIVFLLQHYIIQWKNSFKSTNILNWLIFILHQIQFLNFILFIKNSSVGLLILERFLRKLVFVNIQLRGFSFECLEFV